MKRKTLWIFCFGFCTPKIGWSHFIFNYQNMLNRLSSARPIDRNSYIWETKCLPVLILPVVCMQGFAQICPRTVHLSSNMRDQICFWGFDTDLFSYVEVLTYFIFMTAAYIFIFCYFLYIQLIRRMPFTFSLEKLHK